MKKILNLYLALFFVLFGQPGFAFFLDGNGHYSLRGETRPWPAFSKDSGIYQAIQQSFRLEGEVRFNDRSSMLLELRIFDDPRLAYLGDTAQPGECSPRLNPDGSTRSKCEGLTQSSGEPRYKAYLPKITTAYIKYAFDMCIVEAGRRPRDWGIGIFMDSGSAPFDTDASVYDGFGCKINIQKTQTLGFSFGYDKLAETGAYIDNPYNNPYASATDRQRYDEKNATNPRTFGPTDSDDDLDQFYFTIEYDDRKANAGAPFTKQIGVYFANITAAAIKDTGHPTIKDTGHRGGSNTDLKFLDLYSATTGKMKIFNIFEGKNGTGDLTVPSNLKAYVDLFAKDKANVVSEVTKVIEENGLTSFPSYTVLFNLGHKSLAGAISQTGGYSEYRREFGEKIIKIENGKWRDLEFTLGQARKFLKENPE